MRQRLARSCAKALPGLLTAIEHIGSTAVPGWPLLRDYLRTHPADVQRYAELKRGLAVQYEASAEYTRAKTALIQELTDRARAARGLPSVPVWEE